jgi:hypothetical protein
MPLPKKSDRVELNRPGPHKAEPEAAQMTPSPPNAAWPPLLQLQRTHGNRYVQRLVARLRRDAGPAIQPKLVVGPAGDKYEQEADQVAARVLRMPVNPSTVEEGGEAKEVQPQTVAETVTPVQRQSAAAAAGAGFQVEPEIEQRLAHPSGGQSLPERVRRSLEPRFGADFSGVRVHTDAAADQLNHSLQAQAFTSGQNIFFRRGGYAPASESGQRLLAHELTHVVQQTGAGQGMENAQRSVIQAKILLNGEEAKLEDLLAQWENDEAAQNILTNWSKSEIPHNFEDGQKGTAKQALATAVKSAKKRSKEAPALYKKENLKFLTKDENRLPTLYFKSGNDSGRIRQQHKSGPEVIAETYKVDYFFPKNEDKTKFSNAASKAKNGKVAFKPNLEDYNATLEIKDGYYHAEVTYTNDKDQMVVKVHPSGGKIVTNIEDFKDDQIIKAAYQSSSGLA